VTQGKNTEGDREREVEFFQPVERLIEEETRLILIPFPIVMPVTLYLLIRANSLVVEGTTGTRQGGRSMLNG